MKTLLALSCATACLLFVGCSGGESDDVALEQKDIRPVGETVAPPGDAVKLGNSKTAGSAAAPAKPKTEGE
jgi:hypothetical protein